VPTSRTPASAERLLTREEAAEFLGLKPQTLAAWAVAQRHLPVVKIRGHFVRYRLSDLQRMLEPDIVPAANGTTSRTASK